MTESDNTPAPGSFGSTGSEPASKTVILTLSTIAEVDKGKVALAFNQVLKKALDDVEDRPADSTRRTVNLQVVLTPKLDDDSGVLDVVHTEFRITSKIPAKQTIAYPMLPMGKGRLSFQPLSPLDPRQGTLFGSASEEVDLETGEVKVRPARRS